jgi:hypothetical protein
MKVRHVSNLRVTGHECPGSSLLSGYFCCCVSEAGLGSVAL